MSVPRRRVTVRGLLIICFAAPVVLIHTTLCELMALLAGETAEMIIPVSMADSTCVVVRREFMAVVAIRAFSMADAVVLCQQARVADSAGTRGANKLHAVVGSMA